MSKRIHEQGGVEGVRWNCGWLVRCCKKNKGAIIICGAILLVGASLIARKRLLYIEPPPSCSFLSGDEEGTEILVTSEVVTPSNNVIASTSGTSKQVKTAFITDKDRLALEKCLESEEGGGWNEVLRKYEPTMDYLLLSRRPNGGATQYLSTTRYKYIEDTTQVKNFMIDNDYKKENDPTYVSFKQLDLDTDTGIEYLHVMRKYDIVGYREYVIASKIWEKETDKSFYCVAKAYKHEKAPKPTQILVTNYLAGWRISKASKGGCEIKVFHQEDIKHVLDRFKDKFKTQLFNYIVETEQRLQNYINQNRKPKEERSAASLAQKF